MSQLRSLRLSVSLFLWSVTAAPAGTPGLDAPEPVGAYFGGVFPPTAPGDPSGWDVVDAFPNLTFTDPLMLAEVPGQNQFVVVGKTGRVWRIPKDPAATMDQRIEVLDWTGPTQASEDQGFYGIVFHPNFGQEGQTGEHSVFACYNRKAVPDVSEPDRSYWIVSRFTWMPASGTIDPDSEEILISQYDPHRYHNGGAMFFCGEGYLHITNGDGGASADTFNSGQKINQALFSGMLRIDVDYYPGKPGSHAIRRQPVDDPNWSYLGQPMARPAEWPASYTQGYGIPDDNPWLDPGGGILEEFFAIGLRSPHSAHYDAATGDVWVGDVGQSTWEDLSRVVKGANCQWSYMEGPQPSSFRTDPDTLVDVETPPFHSYDHTVGSSIIGGMRYRGTRWSAFLGGKVIFGDHGRGRIWNITVPEGGGSPVVTEMFSSFRTGPKRGLAGFSTDSEGEIYLMDLGGNASPDGRIMKLAEPAVSEEPPQFLSQTGVFTDLATLATAPGVIPYDVPNPLWSDEAHKRRWIIVPNDGSFDSPEEDIVFSAEGNWVFPPGTVLVKHFEAPVDANDPDAVKRLETRFLVCTVGGGKYGFTYKWNSDGTDAELMEGGLNEDYDFDTGSGIEQKTWSYPSRGDCMVCHNDTAGQALGVRTFHLNSGTFYPSTGRAANQLETLNALGIFDVALTAGQLEDFIEARALDDETAPLEHRVRSYLDTNCSHCHQPGAQGEGFDARLGTPLDLQNLINAIPTRYEELGAEGRYIKPGDSSLSAVFVRAGAVGNGDAMPPLAKNLAHTEGVAALDQYIDGLVAAQFDSPPAPEARYVRLTSLSAHSNRKYAAVCELIILDGEGVPIPHGELSIEDVSSESGTSTLATEAIDGVTGSTANFWQTPSDGSVDHPHHITIDLGSVREVGGFTYVPRQGTSTSNANGRIKGYEVHYSSDGTTWALLDSSGESGEWDSSPAWYTYAPGFNKRAARCQIAGPAGPVLGPFDVTAVFDMDTTGFTAGDIQVTGGSVSKLRGGGYYYVARISPAPGATNVEVSVPADAVSPEGKGSLASSVLSVAAIPDEVAPSTPEDLAAVPDLETMLLTWSPSEDLVGVVAYRIERDSDVIATVQGTSYADTGLDPDTEYHYQVIALDAADNESLPAGISATTLADVNPPSAPEDLSAAPEFTAIQLFWGASTDNVAVDGYRIRRNGQVVGTVEGLSFLDTGLADGTEYHYEVTAIDTAGWESPAATIPATTVLDEVAPEAPQDLVADESVTEIHLSWSASTDNVAVTGYRISRGDDEIATVSGTSYVDSGLDPGTEYSYEVQALDARLNASLPAAVAASTLPDVTPPGPPGNFAGEPDVDSIHLTWTAATDEVAMDGYRIRRNDSVVATVTGLSFTDTGLEIGTEYYYTIVALDEAGNSSEEVPLTVSTLADDEPPTAPGNLAAQPGYFSASLAWSASDDNLEVIAGYEVRRVGVPEPLATVAVPGFTDEALASDTTYAYEVRAIDGAGNLSAPAQVEVATLGFGHWLDEHGLSGQTDADSDHGGLDNFAEFHLGMDPNNPADDLTFHLTCALGEGSATIALPDLQPAGDYHLHASETLEDISDPARRIATLTRGQILAMDPAERSGYTVEVAEAGARRFFILVFEPFVGP